jgi:hypothetical protein
MEDHSVFERGKGNVCSVEVSVYIPTISCCSGQSIPDSSTASIVGTPQPAWRTRNGLAMSSTKSLTASPQMMLRPTTSRWLPERSRPRNPISPIGRSEGEHRLLLEPSTKIKSRELQSGTSGRWNLQGFRLGEYPS